MRVPGHVSSLLVRSDAPGPGPAMAEPPVAPAPAKTWLRPPFSSRSARAQGQGGQLFSARYQSRTFGPPAGRQQGPQQAPSAAALSLLPAFDFEDEAAAAGASTFPADFAASVAALASSPGPAPAAESAPWPSPSCGPKTGPATVPPPSPAPGAESALASPSAPVPAPASACAIARSLSPAPPLARATTPDAEAFGPWLAGRLALELPYNAAAAEDAAIAAAWALVEAHAAQPSSSGLAEPPRSPHVQPARAPGMRPWLYAPESVSGATHASADSAGASSDSSELWPHCAHACGVIWQEPRETRTVARALPILVPAYALACGEPASRRVTAPLAHLVAGVALCANVVQAPTPLVGATVGPWPDGSHVLERLFVRARHSNHGTRLPPCHQGLTLSAFPRPWRRSARAWMEYADNVCRLTEARYGATLRALARIGELSAAPTLAPPDFGEARLFVAWSHSVAAKLLRAYRHLLLGEPRELRGRPRAPAPPMWLQVPTFPPQLFAFGAYGPQALHLEAHGWAMPEGAAAGVAEEQAQVTPPGASLRLAQGDALRPAAGKH